MTEKLSYWGVIPYIFKIYVYESWVYIDFVHSSKSEE